MSEPTDPVDEMTRVLGETIGANALRLTSSRGGYVGGGQPHPTLDSDPAAIEAVARGLLARKVAEPSRASVAPSESGLDVARLAPLIDECYQRGLDAPEAAEFIAAEYARLRQP